MKICQRCHRENADQAKFCVQCGNDLNAPALVREKTLSPLLFSAVLGGIAGFGSSFLIALFYLFKVGLRYWGFFEWLFHFAILQSLIRGIIGALIGLLAGLVIRTYYRLVKVG